MIVFINGAFGVGKTTVAERLLTQLPDSLIFDPEEAGFFLRKVLAPIDDPDDFQDYSLWRSLVVSSATAFRRTYNRPLIMPMSLCHITYFTEIIGGLREIEPNFHHFCLTAPVPALHARLLRRGDTPGGWTWVRAKRCHDSFLSPLFETRIPTENATPDEIVRTILQQIDSD